MRQVTRKPISQAIKQSPEEGSDLPKVTQQGSGKSRAWWHIVLQRAAGSQGKEERESCLPSGQPDPLSLLPDLPAPGGSCVQLPLRKTAGQVRRGLLCPHLSEMDCGSCRQSSTVAADGPSDGRPHCCTETVLPQARPAAVTLSAPTATLKPISSSWQSNPGLPCLPLKQTIVTT